MNPRKLLALLAPLALAACAIVPDAQLAHLTIHADKPAHTVSPMLHGIFYEDINYAGDGGLYAELIQNRSFEHKDSLYAWTEIKPRNTQATFKIENTGGLNENNPHFLRLNVPLTTIDTAGVGFAIVNSGFGGIAVKKGEAYNFSVRARCNDVFQKTDRVSVQLQDKSGRILAQARLSGFGPQWSEFKARLIPSDTTADARLAVKVIGIGQVDLDVISLFPENTYKNRANGMRPDLAQMLADMKPAFMRFPGGCIIEGDCKENMYNWKNTIGDIANRQQNHNRWMDALPIKSPQYYQTFGLGFFEYFQLCEDIGAEPLPVINCGMSCQFQIAKFYMVPLPEMGPYIQDALDLIEFANGPATSTWGAKRAAMGHPEPFNMKYIAIGNEQWGEDYFPRYKLIHDAIKAKYPNITCVTSSGPGVDDAWWNLAWGKFRDKSAPAELVDEHYYRPPRWFYQHAERYDTYDRTGPKVFAGEYAAHPLGLRNNMNAALAESAFLTGLVRNSDIVHLSSYAPLFAKIGDIQWVPDMIWFTNTTAYGTPTYHANVLFGANVGDVVLPLDLQAPSAPVEFQGKGLTLLSENCIAEFRNLKITSGDRTVFAPDFQSTMGIFKPERGDWAASAGTLRSTYLLRGRNAALVNIPKVATISLQARKTSGPGGFGIKATSDTDEIFWLLGARGNTRHELQLSFDANPVEGKIVEGQWHDIKIELDGRNARAYIDGTLAIQKQLPIQKSLYAVATRDNKTNEIILKAVNPTAHPLITTIESSHTTIHGEATITVLKTNNPLEENSLQKPNQVAPKTSTIRATTNFTHTFPPYSITVMKMKEQRPTSASAGTPNPSQ